MSRNRQTVKQRWKEVTRRVTRLSPAVEERPFLGGVPPDIALARLGAAECPKCEAYLLFDSQRERVVDYCPACDHIWTEGEQRNMLRAVRAMEPVRAA